MVIGSGNYIYFWTSKGFSDENIITPNTGDYKPNPELSCFGTIIRREFKGACLKKEKIIYDYGEIINIYIVYEINKDFNIISYPTLENCFFGAVSLTKKVNIDKFQTLVMELVEM